MAAAAQPPAEQRARAGWLRRFGPTGAQIIGGVVASTLWTGVASPGLELLPGLDGLSDDGIAISLQSAVLGIDDGSNRPARSAPAPPPPCSGSPTRRACSRPLPYGQAPPLAPRAPRRLGSSPSVSSSPATSQLRPFL